MYYPCADLVICLDVLIHQVERPLFDNALKNLLESTVRHGLFSYANPLCGSKPVMPKLRGFDYSMEENFQRPACGRHKFLALQLPPSVSGLMELSMKYG